MPKLRFQKELVEAGCDEAGRGCLAGPIVAAGVRLDYRRLSSTDLDALSGVDDSKKLTAARREELLLYSAEKTKRASPDGFPERELKEAVDEGPAEPPPARLRFQAPLRGCASTRSSR